MVESGHIENEFSKFFNSSDYIALKNQLFNYKFRKWMLEKRYKKYNKILNPRILDIGCGISPVSPDSPRTIFIESDKEAVQLLNNNRYDARIGDIKKIPLKNNFVDVIFCSEVLEHVPDYKKGLKEFFRVLKKNGLVFITVPIHMKYWAFDDDYVGHLRRFSPKKLASELKDENFEILEIKPIGSYIERELTKMLVQKAMTRKGENKINRFQMSIFKLVNKIFLALTYLGYLFNNEGNSSIILIVAQKN